MKPKLLISIAVMVLAATSPLMSLEWQKSWEISPLLAQTTEDREAEAEADRLFNQGIQQFDRSQYREAIQSWQQALKIYQEIGDRQGEANSYGNLGNVYYNLGDYETAISYHEKSLAMFREIGDRQGEASCYNNLGNVYNLLGEYETAISFHEKSLAITTEIGDINGSAKSYNNLGNVYYFLGDYEKAISFYDQSLAMATEIGDINGEASSYNNLGNVYQSLGDYETAISFYEKSLAIKTEIGDRNGSANSYNNLGNVYNLLGEYETAISFYEKSLAIKREIGDRKGEANSYNNLGNVYEQLGEYEKAISYYEQSLAIKREIGDRNGSANYYMGLGNVYQLLGKYETAISFYDKSLAITTEIGDRNGTANSYGNLGVVYDQLGEYEKAISYYEKSLAIKTEIGDRNGTANSYNNLGLVYQSLGEYEKAISFYEKSLAIKTEIGTREGQGRTLSNMGFLLEEQNEPEAAIIFFKQSVNIREGIRRDIQGLSTNLQQSYTETIAYTYRRLADLLLSQDRILEAQQVLELLKIQEVQEFTRNRSIRGEIKDVTFLPQEEKIIQQYGNLIAFANKIKQCEDNQCPELKELRDQRNQLKREYNQAVRELATLIRTRRGDDDAFFEPTELSQTSEKIISASDKYNSQPGTMVIYPLVLDDKLRLLFATKGKVVGSREIKQVSRQQLNDTVVKLRLALENPNSDLKELQKTSQQLYDWLIKPLEKELTEGNINHLVFSLDRATRYIPMQVLYDGENYLIENYTVTNVINTQLTDTQARLPDTIEANKILGVGGSNIPGQRKLDHVETEIDFIVKEENNPNDQQGIYPGITFFNQDFHFDSLQNNLEERKLLHIATHGKFTTGSQYDSYLVLGNGEKLTIADIEILGDYLDDVHLVVLSACETALGDSLIVDPNREEGVEINALSYYFLTGGAKTIMASLWQVDDNGTSELMQQFYAKLSQSNQTLTKAEALQKVQLSFLNKTLTKQQNHEFSHPHYWSPFILMGNGI